MKIALYIEEGREQIVLTPETNTEKSILAKMHEPNSRVMSIRKGSFYECLGGWIRHRPADDESTIILLSAPPAQAGT